MAVDCECVLADAEESPHLSINLGEGIAPIAVQNHQLVIGRVIESRTSVEHRELHPGSSLISTRGS